MKTQLSKPARGKASYTDQYKQEALELWRASGRSAAKVAAELGIRPPLLYRWAHLEREANARAASRSLNGASKHSKPRSGACVRRTPNFRTARSLKTIAGHPLRSAAQR